MTDPYANPPLESEGYMSISYAWQTPEYRLDARWDRRTGELTLEHQGRVILATTDPGAFDAGIRLLIGDGHHMLVWHGFTLLRQTTFESRVTPV